METVTTYTDQKLFSEVTFTILLRVENLLSELPV
jgi:hypothetical protein